MPNICDNALAVNGKLLKWLIDKREQLMRHFNEEKPACMPSIEQWIVGAVIYPLVQCVETTFIAVRGMNTLVCEQKLQLSKLALCDVQNQTKIEGRPMTEWV